jgi:hypothetical protein
MRKHWHGISTGVGNTYETNAFRADLGRFENIGNGEIQLKQIMNMEQRKFIRNYLEYKRNTTKPTPKQKTINAESLPMIIMT